MRSRVSVRGQTVVPLPIRRKYGIRARTELEWIDDGEVIFVRPVQSDASLAGESRFKGRGLVEELLSRRREERRR